MITIYFAKSVTVKKITVTHINIDDYSIHKENVTVGAFFYIYYAKKMMNAKIFIIMNECIFYIYREIFCRCTVTFFL